MNYACKFSPQKSQNKKEPNTSTFTLRDAKQLKLSLPYERYHQESDSPERKSIPYFQSNKPNEPREGRSVSPARWQRKLQQREERMGRISNILEDITQRHGHMKNRIEQLRKEK